MTSAAVAADGGLADWAANQPGPLGYDPGLWSMVFPLGMYCVASEALGTALHVKWLVTAGHDGAWVAFAAWAALFAAMLSLLAASPRSRLAPGQRSA